MEQVSSIRQNLIRMRAATHILRPSRAACIKTTGTASTKKKITMRIRLRSSPNQGEQAR
jgi:hypothetical protein